MKVEPVKCPCCGGVTRWRMNGKPLSCDDCKRRCEYIPASEPCAVSGRL